MQIYEFSLHLRKRYYRMKHFLLSAAALVICLCAQAQVVRPEADVHFKAALINDEFDVSNAELAPSKTLAALRLSPYVGIALGDNHRIKVGFDIMKDFGTSGTKPVTELAAWYQYDKNGFTFAAGIFPGTLLKGYYSTAIFSDAARFYDAHYDGFYLGWKGEKSKYEVVFDWCGKFDADRREQFYVLSTGAGWVTPWLALCWEGVFHHYACSATVNGVVDDHLLHPYLKFEFSSVLPMDRLELSLGGMVGYQMDRLKGERYIPKGLDAVVDVRKWGFGVRNQFYYGRNQMPFYNKTDASGAVYGDNLYFRASWWQIRKDGEWGLYDRLDAYWVKNLNEYVSLGVHAVFHFDYLGFLGCQQFIQANFNLENLSLFRRK